MCTVIPQKKVWRVSFFVLLELLKYLPSRLFLLLCSPRLILFSAFWAVIWGSQFCSSQSLFHFYLSKYYNCITSALRDQAFLQFVRRACFEKPFQSIRKMYQTLVPAIRNLVLFFFCFDDVTNTRETRSLIVFSSNQGR